MGARSPEAFYTALDPANRRLCNQAFFTRIILTEDWHVTHEYTGIYDTILDPANRLHAEYWQRTQQLHPDIDYTQIDPDAMTRSPHPWQ